MRHKSGYNKLNLKESHRRALMRNMVTSLFMHEKIETTKAKAKALQRMAEKMITRAKNDSVHDRRVINKDIKDEAVLAKLFTEIGPRFKERNGGYTSILKLGYRKGDAAEMVIIRLVEDEVAPKTTKKKAAAKKKAAPKKEEPKVEEKAVEAPAEEVKAEEPAPAAE